MTLTAEPRTIYLDSFKRHATGNGQAWLRHLRQTGMDRFAEVGFPSAKEEEWRFTNIAPIVRTSFRPALLPPPALAEQAARKFSFGAQAAAELVFVNGRFCSALSRRGELPAGVRVGNLSEQTAGDSRRIEQHLGRHADVSANPFVALNTGFIHDGAFLYLPAGTAIRRPLHLLFVSVPDDQPAVAHPRVLVVAEDGVDATIVETYGGLGEGLYFTNAVAEIVAGAGCRLDHCRVQQETREAFHVATMAVELGRQTQFVSHAASIGSRIARNDLSVLLNGEYADATLNGLVIIGGDQHVDNHTLLRHEKPNCPSHELYKHVLDGRASGVFKGKIFVQKDAQKTNSKQTSKSLLLSEDATMNSQPALEIYADDVKCTHGSTTGPVDEEMVFYLRTRGVSLEAARHLLTYAFAADITRRIRVEPVRARLEDFMAAQHDLPQDLRITDLGVHDQAAL